MEPLSVMNEVPGWLPVLATIATFLGYAIKIVHPLLNEHVEAFRKSKVDDFIFNAVGALMETEARDIKEKTADGSLTKEESRELLVNLGKNVVKEVANEFGDQYLGPNTLKKVADKVETAVVRTKPPGN